MIHDLNVDNIFESGTMIKKITFIFSSGFQTMFTKANFEKMTVYLTAIFRFNSLPFLHQKGYNDVVYTQALECSV